MSQHLLRYYNAKGMYVRTFTTFISLEYLRKENDFGSLYVDFPNNVDPDFFDIDGTFEVLRSPTGHYGYTNSSKTMWFVRLARGKTDENGRKLTHILAYDANSLIDRRIIAYKAGTAQASMKNMRSDTMIKQIMRENMGSLATDTARDLSQYITIAPDNPTSPAPIISKSFPYQKVLPLLQDICDEAREQGFYMCFDMWPLSGNTFRFNVYYYCRGTDRSSLSPRPLVFSLENGRLSYSSLSRDFTEARNYIYAGGTGEESERVLKEASDPASIGLSPFNRCEDFISNTNKDPNDVQSAANARLKEAAEKRVLNGHIQQVPGCLYGTDYDFGDIVAVKYNNKIYDVHLDTITVRVDENNQEEVTINSRNLPDSDY